MCFARELEALNVLAFYVEPTDQVRRHAEYLGGFLGGHSLSGCDSHVWLSRYAGLTRMNSSICCCISLSKVLSIAADNAGMNRDQAQALIDSIDAAAVAIVTAKFGHYDDLDSEHGDVYYKATVALLADHDPNLYLPDLWKIVGL